MKKSYSKPIVSFEDYSLDMPVAANCDSINMTEDLMAQDWFGHGYDCDLQMTEDYFSSFYPDNKLCYYSQAATLFLS